MLAALANRVSLVRAANFFNATLFSIMFSIYNFIIFNMFSIYFLKMSPIIGLRSQNTLSIVHDEPCPDVAGIAGKPR